ncbi:MAG: hypothetical protein JWR27_1769 [Aeromicrobium sp.]|nr:hypothetical protein [Aeromicrobium sp.]
MGDVVVPSVPEPGIDQRRAKAAARTAARRQREEAKAAKAAARAAAADAKREAEARARKERQEERQQEIAAEAQERAEASAARAAEAEDARTAELQAPEPAVEGLDLLLVEDEVVDVVEEPAPEPVLPEPVLPEPASEAETRLAEAREAARRERAEARDVARREREEARTAERVDEDDHIVEPPREPKVPLLERLRRGRGTDDGTRQGRSPRVVVAAVVGGVGLICSVVLAVGAFTVALGTDEANGFYAKLSSVCDTLVGPLRDLFSFSGANADMKEALVAWGAGSLVYLGVFLASQAFLGSGDDD